MGDWMVNPPLAPETTLKGCWLKRVENLFRLLCLTRTVSPILIFGGLDDLSALVLILSFLSTSLRRASFMVSESWLGSGGNDGSLSWRRRPNIKDAGGFPVIWCGALRYCNKNFSSAIFQSSF